MHINIGDLVSRKSYNNDMVFKVIDIDYNKNIVYLKGVNYRLLADSFIEDLVLCDNCIDDFYERNCIELDLNKKEFFYLPGKILHIDGDDEYLDKCMKFYKSIGIKANGITLNEKEIYIKIVELIKEYTPDIVVITGHDALYSKDKGDIKYQNSESFIKAIKEIRKYEKSQDKLIIIAGACQSNYEELIKAGANFASSPKRVNIHALDPAIVASSIALSEKNKSIDIFDVLSKTKYGSDGIGGIITNGTMYTGFPR